jgi:hypothetical protein
VAALLPGMILYLLYRRMSGPQGRDERLRKISPLTAIRSPDRPACSESLYQLSYPEDACTFIRVISRLILFFRTRNVLDESCRDRAHILCPVHFPRNSCRFCGNAEKYCIAGQATDDNKIQRMRVASWITRATQKHTLTIYNTFCFSTAAIVTRTRLSVIFYLRCLS